MKTIYQEYLKFYKDNEKDVIRKDGDKYVSFKYASIMSNFNERFMRLSRGLVFNKETHKVALAGFEKFFNVGQLNPGEMYSEEFVNMYSRLDFQDEYTFYEKLDGSLILVSIDEGELVVGTTGGINTEHAQKAIPLIKDSTVDFLKENPELCLLFEMVGPDNKIVVDYDENELVLLNATNKYILDRVDKATLKYIQESLNYKTPKKYILTKDELKDFIETNNEIEGFVTENKYGNLVKIKTSQYIIQHRLRTTIEALSAVSIIEAFEESVLDDWLPELNNEKRVLVEEVLKEYIKLKEAINEYEKVFLKMDRKEFFLNKEIPEVIKHGVVAKDKIYYLKKYFKNKESNKK